ncbi:MAG: diguanylate cyclase [Oscillospiraceae bacterium]|jgi:diguanylate cyclase (GGDEF)-like protein|nr:diguanylate cyclase [Oscillospiraceae bacterium]
MNQDAQLLLDFLGDKFYDSKSASLNLDLLSSDFRELGEGIVFLADCIDEFRRFSSDLARGDIETPLPSRANEIVSPLKSLQASLRHLTWQAKQVAQGDYSQRVEFMVEFSGAFNSMIAQLDRQRNDLLATLAMNSRNLLEEQKEQVKLLEEYAYKDSLTKAYNRFFGMRALAEWMDHQRTFNLIFADLDYLKYVNDTMGHAAGDAYLISVTELLHKRFPDDLVCRIGGDEFMILTGRLDAVQIDSDLREISRDLKEGDETSPRQVSFGIVLVESGCPHSSSELLRLADERMYACKRANKRNYPLQK